MATRIAELFTEQTSATEVIMFILVAVVVCMGLALLAYIPLILAVWAVRLNRSVRLSKVLIPSREQFAEYLGEYLLAIATSVILAATMVVKDDLVQTVLNTTVDIRDGEKIAGLFPLYEPPVEVGTEIVVSTLLQPVLSSGGSEPARLLVESLLPPEGARPGYMAWLTDRNLVLACVVLAALYLLWLASRRFHHLVRNGDRDPGYGRTVKGVFVLSLCIALLLASPALLANDSIAESAVAVMARRELPLDQQATAARVTIALRKQRALFGLLPQRNPNSAEGVSTDLAGLQRRLSAAERQLRRLASSPGDERLGALAADLRSVREELDRQGAVLREHDAGLEALASGLGHVQREFAGHDQRLTRAREGLVDHGQRIKALEGRLDHGEDIEAILERTLASHRREDHARRETGVLLVHASPKVQYMVSGPRYRERHEGPARIELAPGQYELSTRGLRVPPVDIQAGNVQAVWLTPGVR